MSVCMHVRPWASLHHRLTFSHVFPLRASPEAYAASRPRDVAGLQRELMMHGPVEVAFFAAWHRTFDSALNAHPKPGKW